MRTSIILPFLLLLPGWAAADCRADIDALAPRVAAVPQKAERVRIQGLLERARRELLENDETECGWAVDRVRARLGGH